MHNGLVLDEPEDGERDFQLDRKEILIRMIKYNVITKRFEKMLNNPVLKAARTCFEQRQWPLADKVAMEQHGCTQIRFLLRHYKAFFTTEECVQICADWQVFKEVMAKQPQLLQLIECAFWEHIGRFFYQPKRHQLLVRLRTVVALIPLDTSECERGFSKMNLIMGAMQSRMGSKKLDWLMRINLLGPELEDFDPLPIVQWWIESAKRGRQINKLKWHMQKVCSGII
jgi:hypothetical protein